MPGFPKSLTQKNLLLYSRWPWHLLFWLGYILYRFWAYYQTVKYYTVIFLQFMLLSEIMFVATTYSTLWLYRRLFERKKFIAYFIAGTAAWILYLYCRTAFQCWMLQNEPQFNWTFTGLFFTGIAIVIAYFIFITSSKYFKDGFITQQFEAQRKQQQLIAEVNNLKSQIAPHFLFNTLNNLYGLAVEKSDKLPQLMLRLSDLLRHSLYETQKPLVPITGEIAALKSYIELERIRLEDNLKLTFHNSIPADAHHQIAPLILIVFIENAFKHAKLVQREPITISIATSLEEDDWFEMILQNNYNTGKTDSPNGIGLINVRRRLEVLYPNYHHRLSIEKDDTLYTVNLQLKLAKGFKTVV